MELIFYSNKLPNPIGWNIIRNSVLNGKVDEILESKQGKPNLYRLCVWNIFSNSNDLKCRQQICSHFKHAMHNQAYVQHGQHL